MMVPGVNLNSQFTRCCEVNTK